MRGRIRTIKPEVFSDETLEDLEHRTGLPVFRVFLGLWCFADREGRFEWLPRALRGAIMPCWDGDMAAALDALASRSYIIRYTVGGKDYGYVRAFSKHQQVNAREAKSVLPPPNAHACTVTPVHSRDQGSEAPTEQVTETHVGNETRRDVTGNEWRRDESDLGSDRSTDPPSVPGLNRVAHVEAQGQRPVWRDLDGWEISDELYAYAETEGLPRDRLRFRVDQLRKGPIGGKRGTFDRTDFVRGLVPQWRTWEETDRAKAIGNRRRDGPNQPNAGLTGLEIFDRQKS